jgi:hypothetical protein
MRMIVCTFAMGTLLWGMVLGDALEAWLFPPHGVEHKVGAVWGVGMIIILGALAAGTPLPRSLAGQQATAERLREITREAQASGVDELCLVGFSTKGSFLRIGNAQGVVGYESRRKVAATPFNGMEAIPAEKNCAVVVYDDLGGYENILPEGVPLTVQWHR